MTCPKCGEHIPTFDLKPNCRHCGVNIMIYTQEHELSRDAKRAELEFASARIVVAKIKAAFIAGGLQIARIVFTLLAVAALIVPFADLTFTLPMFQSKISVGGLGVYDLFNNGMLTALPAFAKNGIFGGATIKALILILVLVLLALAAVTQTVTEILSFLNIKKTAKIMSTVGFIGVGLSVLGGILALVFSLGSYPSVITFKAGFGALVSAAMFAVFAVINLKIYKKDIPLDLRENDLERKEMLKKVKSGEVDIESLPLPVFETEQEKQERLSALAEALKHEEEGNDE